MPNPVLKDLMKKPRSKRIKRTGGTDVTGPLPPRTERAQDRLYETRTVSVAHMKGKLYE